MRRYLPCALAVAFAISIWKHLGLNLKHLLPHGIVDVSWVLVYPFCYWSTYHSTLTFIDKHYDESFGAYFFAFTVCLRLLLIKWKDSSIINFGFGLLDTIAALIPCLQLVYFANYQYPITEAASIALLQTNPEEAKEYLLLNLGYGGIIASVVVLFLMLLYSAHFNKFKSNNIKLNKRCVSTAMLICLATVGYGS